MNVKKAIVNSFLYLPNWLNKILLFINKDVNLIYGKKYKEYKALLCRDINKDNTKQLISIVNYAINNVPFYNKYTEIKSVGDLTKIKFINKDIVADNFYKLQSLDIKKNNYDLVTTGGTTGKPLRMLLPKSRYIKERATLNWVWNKIGFNHHTRAVLRNHKLKSNQIYKINPITKEFVFDGFRLSDEYYLQIYKIIKKNRIKFIHAYPSNAYSFAKFMYNEKLDFSFLIGFISSSENILKYQKDLIEKKMKLEFLTFYGHSEKLVLAWYCKHCQCSHVESSYGYFELIDAKGNVITKVGEVGEIVGTTLNNQGFPLIRYRTDDFAELVGFRCEYEDRDVISIKNIRGRWTGSYIFVGDGSKTTPTALNLHDDLYLHIDGIQYVQERKGELIVLIIKGKNFNNELEKRLQSHFIERLKDTKITLKYVDGLIKQKNGKFLDLISKVK